MDSSRLDMVPSGTVNLDTVRTLHQTVVSLRTALEISKNELKELKEKYEQHSNCIEFADVIEKLTLENHILRRKIIDSEFEKEPDKQNIKLEFPYSSTGDVISNASETDIRTTTENIDTVERFISEEFQDTDAVNINFDQKSHDNRGFSSAENINSRLASESLQFERNINLSSGDNTHNTDLDFSVPKQEHNQTHHSSYKTKLELSSKFDVRINVRTLKDGSVSSTTSETDSISIDRKKENEAVHTKVNFHSEEKRGQFVDPENQKGDKINIKTTSKENIKMAVPNDGDVKSKTDKFDVQVRITSEENLVVKENVERSRRKDTLNLDVDDLSLRSLSEGDNSVFSEGGTSPINPRTVAGTEDKLDHEASGNESEEVDDIELIFTTDESKDMSNLQEDLVSIRDTDQWVPQSASTTHSTPILIKFHTLDPDTQPGADSDNAENENQENSSLQTVIAESTLRVKRVSLPNDKEIRHVAFNSKGSLDLPGRGILKSCDNRSDNMLYKKSPNASTRRLDSVDSLTCEYNRGLSLDNTKSSSFELGSSMDILHRDDSVDSFHRTGHLGHRFSVFAERDISKCGTSEDDLTANLNLRRNTCPNPFQFRAAQHRGLYRGAPVRAGAGAGAGASGTGRVRPVLREYGYPRRENGAQTDVSALPPRWSSDGHLAYKLSVPRSGAMPTLPQRTSVVTSRRVTAPDARPSALSRRCDEARRVLLSDIGFTSMVPELSRSADPVWALAKRIPNFEETSTNSVSKFLSRGSSYRSPSVSMDRSNEWTNRSYLPTKGPKKALMNVKTTTGSEYIPVIEKNRQETRSEGRAWRCSLPDVRSDDTEELLDEAESFLRRSIDNLHSTSLDFEKSSEQSGVLGRPYIPAEPRHLRLGHTVKLITPHGRIAVGRVRYVGIAGGNAASSGVVVGAEFVHTQYPGLARNDGTHRGRRYFLASPLCTALFVPFTKIVMAWAI